MMGGFMLGKEGPILG